MTYAIRNSVKSRNSRYTLLPTIAFAALVVGHSELSQAGATFKIDDTKWVSIGAGLRTSFRAQEDAAANSNWNNDVNLDNIRLYLSGQIHKYVKVEFNTDCQTCNNGGEVRVLDAIGKFEVDSMYNLWVGANAGSGRTSRDEWSIL